jgi:hypothetical protein
VEKNDPRTWSYEDALNNFEEFCNYFDAASASAAIRGGKATTQSRLIGSRGTQSEDASIDVSPTRGDGPHEHRGVSE